MRIDDKLKIQRVCKGCELHDPTFFCEFENGALVAFESLKITNTYPKGSSLFVQGQPATGIYMLCQGRVKLCTYSRDGKAVILRVAEAGEVLGMSAAVTDSVHEATAEVVETCQVNFIEKHDFLRFLKNDATAGIRAAQQLSRNYHSAYTQIRSLALSNSVSDKFAKLLVEWSRIHHHSNGSVHFKMTFTHEEMAEMIGTSRETITRLLKDFKSRDLISLKGSELVIHDIRKLEMLIQTD
jgi:CRP/FNR family transcriptional regulator